MITTRNNIIKHAEKYQEKGLVFLPYSIEWDPTKNAGNGGKCFKPLFSKFDDFTHENCLNKAKTVDPSRLNAINIKAGKDYGVFVIDVDKKPDITTNKGNVTYNGFKYWQKLIKEHGELDTWKVITGNGGFHYYFKWEDRLERFKSATDIKFGEKSYSIDIRTNNAIACAPPSSYFDDQNQLHKYTWAKTKSYKIELGTMPDWLFDLINQEKNWDATYKKSLNPTPQRAREITPQLHTNVDNNVDNTDVKQVLDLLALLDHEKARKRDRWRDLGFILFNTFGNEGYSIWIDYIKNYIPDTFDEPECNNTWNSMKKDHPNPLCIGSLYRYVYDDNPDGLQQNIHPQLIQGRIFDPGSDVYYIDISRNKFDELKLKQTLLDTIVYIENGGTIYYATKTKKFSHEVSQNGQTINNISPKMNTVSHNSLMTALKKIKLYKKRTAWDCLIELENDVNIKNSYSEMVFFPQPNVDTKFNLQQDYFNTFNGFRASYFKHNPNLTSDVEKVLHHIRRVYCDDKTELFDYFIRWLAHLIQFPHKKTGVCIQMLSRQGAGKGIFWDWFCEKVIGVAYSNSNTKVSDVLGQFNAIIKSKILMILNEVKADGQSTKEYNLFKSLITDSKMNLQEKFVNTTEVTDYTNWVICTNNRFSIKVEADDRRFLCLKLSSCYVGNYTYFKELTNALNTNTAIDFIQYLKNLDLNEFYIQKIPQTDLKNEIRLANLPEHELFINDIKNKNFKIMTYGGKIFTKDLFRYYLEWCEEAGYKTKTNLTVFRINFEDSTGLKPSRLLINRERKLGYQLNFET